jgi:hypothetical protein
MPDAAVAEQMVTGTPPMTAIRFSVWSVSEKKAIDSPSGENTDS